MRKLLALCLLLSLVTGCQLNEIRGKTRGGFEARHSGAKSTNSDRYSATQAIEFKWDNGVNTAVAYRRRDIDNGSGDNDNGVWLEISYPLWRRPKKPDTTAQRLAELERRLAELESQPVAQSPQAATQ